MSRLRLGVIAILMAVVWAHGGSAAEVRLVTWNLEWFFDHDTADDTSAIGRNQAAPSAALFTERVEAFGQAIATLRPTILALQEVENATVVERLADHVRARYGLRYRVAFLQGEDTYTGQDVVFLVEEDLTFVVRRFAFAPPAPSGDFKNLSKHLALELSLENERFTIVTVHLITNTSDRMRQARTLRGWVAPLLAEGPVVVLGDFNAAQRFNQTTPESEMGIIRGFQTSPTDDDLFDVHERIGGADRETHVGGKELDRILLSPGLVNGERWQLSAVSTQRALAIRGTPDQGSGVSYTLPAAERDVSDHFPLMVTLASPGETDTEPQAPTREQLLRAVGALEAELQSLAEQLSALKALVEQLQE